MEKLQRLPDVVQLRILRRLMAGDLQPSQAPPRSLPPSQDLSEFLWRCLSPAERDSRVPLSSLGWALRQAVFHPVRAGGANRRLYLAILQNEKTMVRILAGRLRHQREQTRRLEQDVERDFDRMESARRDPPYEEEEDRKLPEERELGDDYGSSDRSAERRRDKDEDRRRDEERERRRDEERERRREEDRIDRKCGEECDQRWIQSKASCMRECRDKEAGIEPQGFLSKHGGKLVGAVAAAGALAAAYHNRDALSGLAYPSAEAAEAAEDSPLHSSEFEPDLSQKANEAERKASEAERKASEAKEKAEKAREAAAKKAKADSEAAAAAAAAEREKARARAKAEEDAQAAEAARYRKLREGDKVKLTELGLEKANSKSRESNYIDLPLIDFKNEEERKCTKDLNFK